MANTFTATRDNTAIVMGNKRMLLGKLTMTDGVGGGAINVGLNWIDTCMMTPSTANTNGGGVLINTAASAAGEFVAGSCTSGDTFQVMVVSS